jgi:hypothetical protein
LGKENREEYSGQSALMAPISLTAKGDGILVQAGSSRTESLVAFKLDMEALQTTRETSRFQPRREMHLGALGPKLAEMYSQGLVIDEIVEPAPEPEPEPEVEIPPDAFTFEQVPEPEPFEENVVPPPPSVPEAMSLSTPEQDEEE